MPDRAWRSRVIRGAAAMAAMAIAAGVPSAAIAQAANPSAVVARPGEVVRLRTAQWEYTGRLIGATADSAFVLLAPDTARVAKPDVLRIQVQRGTRRSAGRIALVAVAGAAAGTILGGYAGVLAECGTDCSDDGEWSGIAGGVSGAALGMVVGGIAGGMWGAKKRYPRWVDAVLNPD
jgi:hypothetical protein